MNNFQMEYRDYLAKREGDYICIYKDGQYVSILFNYGSKRNSTSSIKYEIDMLIKRYGN